MFMGSCLVVLLFFGGWHPLPWVTWTDVAGWVGSTFWNTGLAGALLAIATFVPKTFLVLFFFIWVRWTLPRLRYDQVMRIGWRMLLPLSIANVAFYAIVIAFVDTHSLLP